MIDHLGLTCDQDGHDLQVRSASHRRRSLWILSAAFVVSGGIVIFGPRFEPADVGPHSTLAVVSVLGVMFALGIAMSLRLDRPQPILVEPLGRCLSFRTWGRTVSISDTEMLYVVARSATTNPDQSRGLMISTADGSGERLVRLPLSIQEHAAFGKLLGLRVVSHRTDWAWIPPEAEVMSADAPVDQDAWRSIRALYWGKMLSLAETAAGELSPECQT